MKLYARVGLIVALAVAIGSGFILPRSSADRDAAAAREVTLAHPPVMHGEVATQLSVADQQATTALTIYQTMDYPSALFHAKDAYQKVLSAAAQINVPVEREAWPADYKAHGANYMFTDDLTRRRLP